MVKRLFGTIIFLAILGGLGWWGYNAVVNKQININHWFVGGMMRGVDVSSYQGEIDFWTIRKQGIAFAYIKATEGSTHVDTEFQENWQNAAEAQMPAGAYHFFSYEASGTEQAENFIKTVGDSLDGRLIPAVDMELSKEQKTNPPEKSEVVRSLRAFVASIEEKYGVKPLIYATKDYFEQYLKDDFKDYPRWVRSVYWPVFIEVGGDWAVWQYDDHGKLEGYHGTEEFIDMNVINSEFGLEKLKMK